MGKLIWIRVSARFELARVRVIGSKLHETELFVTRKVSTVNFMQKIHSTSNM